MSKVQLNKIDATADNSRLGRMLGAGRVTATMRSKKSGEHITLTLKCSVKKDERWQQVPFAEASHVYISQGQGSWGSPKVGTYYPNSGLLYLNRGFDTPAWEYAVKQTLYAAVTGVLDTDLHEIREANYCGKCGKELTDPVSIERGIGPTCYGDTTGSVHYRKAPESDFQTQAKATAAVLGNPPHPNTQPTVDAINAEVEARRQDRKGREIPRTFEALAEQARKNKR